MSFLDDLLGNTSADASRKAAADTYAKQQAATSQIQGQGANYATSLAGLGKNYATDMSGLARGYQPWINTGSNANDAVGKLISDPSSVASLPGYQFDLAQGARALDHSAIANGNLFSGKQGKALETFGTNLADKTYGDQLSRLLGISQQGLGALGGSNAIVGQGLTGGLGATTQGLTGQLGANTSAYGGNMTSAGTIGQGDVAAANAKMQGMQGLLNFGGNIIGGALGGGFGKLSGYAKNGFNSLFGGGSPSGYGA